MRNRSLLHAATPGQLRYQEPARSVMEGIIDFHHDLIFVVVGIAIFTAYLIVIIVQRFGQGYANDTKESRIVENRPGYVIHGRNLELGWTITPALILLGIAFPSLALLYSIEEIVSPQLTLKVVGHQWYWTYEYSNELPLEGVAADECIQFDSYMLAEDDLALGDLRLLEVDQRVVLPIQQHIRVICTAADVLHCWACPSLGIKIDCCPGRLNQVAMFINKKGLFYGQCSELCGVNHGFIPITIEGVNSEDFVNWYVNKYFED